MKTETEFEDRIKPFAHVYQTYQESLDTAKEMLLDGEDLDYFLSKNCRIWFFENHLRVEQELSDQAIRSVNESPIVPFRLSANQLRVLDRFEKRMRIGRKFRHRIMKCRRAKISTIYIAIAYHLARFNENKKGLVFSDRLETSRKLRRILDNFYFGDSCPKKPEIGKKTLCEGLYLHPKNTPRDNTQRDSYILLGSGEQKNSGIGGSLDYMVWSECSLTNDALTHWTTISPSMQGALFDVAESTPSLTGQDDIIFPAFEHPTPECDSIFIGWPDVPEYRIDDEIAEKAFAPFSDHHLYGKEVELLNTHPLSTQQMLWRRFKLDELKSATAFRQVFPISQEEAFYSSAGLFFAKTLIKMTEPKERIESKQVIFTDQGSGVSAFEDQTGIWKIYRRPTLGGQYLVVADTSEGKYADKDGRDPDYCTAIIFRLDAPMEEVAILRERLPPEVFAEQIACAHHYYNDALIIPERNGPGLAMIVRLVQLAYNIYREHRLQQGAFVMTQDYGFQTTSVTKFRALSSLCSIIRDEDKGLILHSDIIRQEMGKFAQVGIKLGALPGYHDDTVTCCWLAAEAIFQMPHLLTKSKDYGVLPQGAVANIPRQEPRINRVSHHVI